MSPVKRLVPIIVAALLVASVANVATALARPKVFKEIPTRATISVSGSAATGATAKVVYTAKDPRCLAAKRFKRAGGEHIYFQAYAYLITSTKDQALPGHGALHPVSPFGKTRLEWEGSFPASALADGTGLRMFVGAPGSNGQGLPYFKVAYNQGGRRVILKCEQLKGATYAGFAGTKFIVKEFPFQ
jgi:hypothetical protein